MATSVPKASAPGGSIGAVDSAMGWPASVLNTGDAVNDLCPRAELERI